MALGAGRHQRKPRIGVTGNHRYWSPSWFSIRFAVLLAGGKPLRVSVRHEQDIDELDGLIVSGGDDIHPSLYGGETMPKADYDQPRDDLEKRFIKHALDKGLPMLGICRGYQLINAVLGGTLFGDIRGMRSKTSNFGTILPRKTACIEQNSYLGELLGSMNVRINSLHHQAVDETGEGLVVAARDLDDFIQAVECTERNIMGVQWHPEYLAYHARQRRLFAWLVEKAS